jgi:hypothetical protein
MSADPGAYAHTGGNAELWKFGTYAPSWFADAQREASLAEEQARLREIIFAVCAVESYLFEWVRDSVLNGEFWLLMHYFPVKQRRLGIVERWKEVINHLHKDGIITGKPTYGEQYWKEFTDLVDFRNGLVHGLTSRPDTEGLQEAEKPEPTQEQLAQKTSGWAVKVVVNLITKQQ